MPPDQSVHVGHSTPWGVPSPRVPKRRLDTLLAERGLFESRSRAAAAVMAGEVRVGGRPAGRQAGRAGRRGRELAVDERAARTSRAGASSSPTRSTRSGIDPAGRRCLDVGASTGGFTDCLLQRGAAHVVALDVAYGELHWTLRNDERVTVLERRNAARCARRAALRARPDRRRRLLHLAAQGAARPCWRPRRRASTAWRWSSRSSRSGASAVGKGGVVRDGRRAPARRWSRWPQRARGARRVGARLRLLGPARARRATARRSSGWPRPGAPGARRRPGGGGAEGRAVTGRRRAHGLHPRAPGRRPRTRCGAWSSWPREAGVDAAPPGRGGREARARARATGVELGADPRRRRPLRRARRRRHDPDARCAASRARGCRCSRSTSARSASSRRSSRDELDASGIERALRGEFDVLHAARRSRSRRRTGERGRRSTTSRSTAAPDVRVAELAYAVEGEELGRGALRRARGRHAGGLDGLQPRQRRAGAGLGRGGLRRLVHRAAHAHGAGAGRRARRRARGHQPLARRAGRRDDRRPAGVRAGARRERSRSRFAATSALLAQAAGRDASTTACARSSAAWLAATSTRSRHARSVRARWYTCGVLLRAANREPAADRAGRAAARRRA